MSPKGLGIGASDWRAGRGAVQPVTGTVVHLVLICVGRLERR
jgi:hypothetical protein